MEAIKGFIEVTYLNDEKVLINTINIVKVIKNVIFFDSYYEYVKESYEEIKQLIINAQK